MEEIDLIKPLENINIAEVCRACFETCEQYKILFDEAECIDKRTLGDVFFDVVKIEMKANAETPPSRICLTCSNDLITAYNFIQKSQKNNLRLHQYLQNANIKKPDCLTEFPIDIPNDQNITNFLQIKVENEAIHDYDYNDSIADDDRNSPGINYDSDESDYEPLINKKEKIKKLECTYCNRIFKRQDFFENHMKKHKDEVVNKKEVEEESEDEANLKCEECDFSCDSKLEMKKHTKSDHSKTSKNSKKTLKSRSQRSSISTRSQRNKLKQKSGRFECDYCSKTFAWKKDLFRHEKTHEPNTKKYACPHCDRRFIRKDKLQSHVLVHLGGIVKPRCSKATLSFSRQLYSQEKFKEMICMICNYDKAVNVGELRRHISLHDLLIVDFENSECVKRFYDGRDIGEIKSLIDNQIKANQFGKLHSIVNANGLEMGISDSDESDEEIPYSCEVCSESFNRKHKLIAHSFSGHTVDECPYKCEKCKLEFTCREVFDSHQKHHCNNVEKEFYCENCPARFTWPKNLAAHKCNKESESSKDKNVCQACGEVFTTLKDLRVHKKTKCGTVELDKESTTCEICGKVFSFPRDLRKHKKIHIPDGKSHDCSVCGEKFLRSDNLRNHLKSHSAKAERPLQAKKLVCMLCGDRFKNIGSLRYHLFNHSDGNTEIDFEHCGFVMNFYPGVGKEVISDYIKNCFNEQKLSQLYLAVNKIGLEMTLSDSDSDAEELPYKDLEAASKTYFCELCNVKFPRRQEILQHQYTEHDLKETSFPHKCAKCEDQFVSGALLERHFKSECQNDLRTNACIKCGIKFIWPENLVAHTCFREEKSPEDNKQCEVCGKKFIWLKDLHRHKRSHIPYEKKFECLVCTRKFNRKDNMRAHMKVHTAESQTKDKAKTSIKWEEQDENLCKPNGQKVIQCKICLSKHNTIKDLTTHLMSHKDPATFKQREAEAREISMMIYGKQMEMQTLERAICKDLEKGSHTRFYSITNETGYELNLDDSETCSDFDADDDDTDDDDEDVKDRKNELKGYICQMCSQTFNRKFKMFEHQRTEHQWEELPYECNRCGARYVCEKIYQLHLQNECENNEKQFKCRICPMKFAWKENLKNHEKYMHDQNPAMPKKHHCDTCGKSFLWVKDLARHQKTHQTEDEKFECTWCFRVFMRRDNLKVHMKVHQNATHILLPDIYYLARPNGTKNAQCKLCDQKYTNISDLAEHIQNGHIKLQMLSITPNPASYSITNALGYEMDINDSETEREGEEEKYICEICDARYNRRFKLLQHQQSLHYSDNIPHKCIDCSFKCVSELVLNYHMRTQCMNLVKQFRCSKCTMRFMWKENLENHESLIHDGKRKHTCTICKKDFATQHDLRNHTECKAPADEKMFKCELCDRKYNRKDRLMNHVKVHTAGAKEKKTKRIKGETAADKKFLCAFCGKEVSSSSNLVIHMRRHTGEKPFKCEFCNKGFPRSSDLACHRRTHTGERPHKCTVCEKAFSRSYKLQTHMRIHSGERPYKCTYCEKSFTQSNDLTLHVRRHTGERPYVCETCGERFIQGTALKNHRRMRGHYEI